MRFSLALTIVLIATILVGDLASASTEIDGKSNVKLQEAPSLSGIETNDLQNETEKSQQEIGGEC